MTTLCFVGGLLCGAALRARADSIFEHGHPAVVEGEIVVGSAAAVREAERITYRASH